MKQISRKELARVEGGSWLRFLWRVIRDGAIYDGVKYVGGKYLDQLDEISRDKGINSTPWYGPHGGGFK